jgi:hypothetical protein
MGSRFQNSTVSNKQDLEEEKAPAIQNRELWTLNERGPTPEKQLIETRD